MTIYVYVYIYMYIYIYVYHSLPELVIFIFFIFFNGSFLGYFEFNFKFKLIKFVGFEYFCKALYVYHEHRILDVCWTKRSWVELPSESCSTFWVDDVNSCGKPIGLESYQKPLKQNEDFQCNQCDANFKTVKGLKIHIGKSHKEASPPQEMLRGSSSQPSLSLSPIKDQNRTESCHNCDKEMSPTHLCQDDPDLTLDDVKICECGCGSDFDPCPAPHHKHSGCAKSCKTCLNVQMQLQMVNLMKDLKDIVT